ncbi:hypothetical protein F4X86_02995 [Candidatus Saccharibacteria bacterium]|nr:hypothetical protein [Candidatus Saccharibacteria bacterium]
MNINDWIMTGGGLAALIGLLIVIILAATGKKPPAEEVIPDFDAKGVRRELARQLPGLLERPSSRYGDGGSAQGTIFVAGRNDDSYQESYRRAEPGDDLAHYHTVLNATLSPGEDPFVHTRTNLPHKTGLIVPDISGGWMPGSQQAWLSRRDVIATTADSLFQAAVDCRFQPGVVLPVADSETLVLPCGSSPAQAGVEIRRLIKQAAVDGLTDCLDQIGMRLNELEFAIVVSDFMSEGWEEKLAAIGSRLTLLAIQIVDPDDVELPNVGWMDFEHGGEFASVNTSKGKVRSDYREEAAGRQDSIEAAVMERAGGRLFRVRTDAPLDSQLKQLRNLERQPVPSRV